MKGKKTACTLLVVILILGMTMVSVHANPEPELFVDPPTYTAVLLDEVFTIDINIANVTDLLGFDVKLGYDTTILDALDAVIGPFPSRPFFWFSTEIHEQEGYVWVAATSTSAVDGDGTLATVTFKATHAESASCTLDLYETTLYNSYVAPIPHSVEDGGYNFAIPMVTVATDKLNYLPWENVTVYGNLTVGGTPFQGLVALQVIDPMSTIVCRTIEVGATPPGNITIVDVVPCDLMGNPKNSFWADTQAYFNVTVRNDGTKSEYVTIRANAYDGNMVPLGVTGLYNASVAPGAWLEIIAPIYIPDWAASGTGTVYASAFTDIPSYGGVPYCPEKSATFQITGGGGGGGGGGGAQGSGDYNLTFRLSPNAWRGIYRAYASTLYHGRYVANNTVFGANVTCVPGHYPTIQAAVDAATPTNNTILVFPATYNEHVTVNKANLTLVGADPSNTIINGSGTGTVVTVTADNVKINRFTIKNSGSFPNSGITLTNSSDSNISENIITSNNGCGINVNSSDNNAIKDNILSNNDYGINVNSSDYNDIKDNILSNNDYGIYLNHSTSATLTNNNLISNKYNFGVFGNSISDFTHYIDTSNTVNGKPIIYVRYQQNREVPSNAGFLAIVGSMNVTVRDLDLTENGQGVLFAFTTDSLIERVNTINNQYGIYMVNSHRNTIIGSEVSNNTVGIYQSNSNENIICHNDFIDNTNQTDLYQSSNTWNDGAGKGNYWSDYMGNDTNGDGVGDTLLPHQGVDWYPLMESGMLVHDIAMISVTPVIPYNVTSPHQGWKVNVTVTFKNKGDFTETFVNITAYYEGNITQTKTITEITPLTQIATNLTWDTTDVPSCHNYTISAYVHPVPGETNTLDNTIEDGTVYVRLMGDVNEDNRVRSNDIIILGKALFTDPIDKPFYYTVWGDLIEWNPDADVNGDGRVRSNDIILLGKHLFEECTP